jgi:hypothetical protein
MKFPAVTFMFDGVSSDEQLFMKPLLTIWARS